MEPLQLSSLHRIQHWQLGFIGLFGQEGGLQIRASELKPFSLCARSALLRPGHRPPMLSRVFRGRAAYQLRSLSTAYTYAGTGDPAKVISRSSIKPLSAPASNEINVNWLAAGVDPVDLAALSGSPSATAYTNTSFPAVPGNEGVAVVIAVGPSVKGIAEGDHVIPIKVG